MRTLLDQPAFWVLLAMVGSAAVCDLRTGLIPNRLVALGAMAGVLVQLLAVVLGGSSLGQALLQMGLGFLVCTLVPLVLWWAGALGGGDLKLFAAIGLCVGPGFGLDIQLWAHVLAVLFLPIYFVREGNLRSALGKTGRLFLNTFTRRAPVELHSFRFAPAIFAAVLWVTFLGERP
jgi:prepilin peptidase CpaA